MNKRREILYLIFCLLMSSPLLGQRETFFSRSSLGIMLGGSYYIGDINPYHHFRQTNLAGGINYQYYINGRLSLRGSFKYGKVEGYDTDSKDILQQKRNLSFESPIYEFSTGIEFNYMNYRIGNDEYYYTPYLFLDIGVFRMNPQTIYNGNKVELQPAATEGQGSSLSSKKPYSLNQFTIPFGIGFKFNVREKMAISFEYGLRKTFTDYLDDIGDGNFINYKELLSQNGEMTADLSDRSDATVIMTGKRGNPTTKDWYAMFGVSITFSLGNSSYCHFR